MCGAGLRHTRWGGGSPHSRISTFWNVLGGTQGPAHDLQVPTLPPSIMTEGPRRPRRARGLRGWRLKRQEQAGLVHRFNELGAGARGGTEGRGLRPVTVARGQAEGQRPGSGPPGQLSGRQSSAGHHSGPGASGLRRWSSQTPPGKRRGQWGKASGEAPSPFWHAWDLYPEAMALPGPRGTEENQPGSALWAQAPGSAEA